MKTHVQGWHDLFASWVLDPWILVLQMYGSLCVSTVTIVTVARCQLIANDSNWSTIVDDCRSGIAHGTQR